MALEPGPPRLPGITFAPAPPEPGRILPRMDIAVFVGFAERGPIDTPTVVEDVAAFTSWFGGELTFVRDAVRGETVHGQLSAAVHAFFRNGGRRCWVIRVAGPIMSPDAPEEMAPVDASQFLDPELVTTSVEHLLAEANFIRYERTPCRPLRGIHAALEIEEATIIAVPDAALPRWAARSSAPLPVTSAPAPQRETSDPFQACAVGPPEPPDPIVRRTADPGRFLINWEPVDGATEYEGQRRREPGSASDGPDFLVVAPPYAVIDAEDGTYGYRFRSIGPGGTGDWSPWIRVLVDATPTYEVPDPADRTVATEIHAALLRLCAARGDMFAILSLPGAVGVAGAIDHVAELRTSITGVPGDLTLPSARDADPRNILSFGALYHPWVISAQSSDAVVGARSAPASLTVVGPPDGCVAGVFADRAERRGAWIAPANVALRDIVGLSQPLTDDELVTLHEGQVNVVRQTPSGFRALATHTLSLDPAFRPINVRRLLSLLRRLALLRGVDYVFEPNDNAFRRRIQRGFEVVMASLFERGAFAGSRASDAFRVVVGDPPNSRQSIDSGRLIVELKVAPSTPLEFLTVRLVRSGERLAVEAA